MSSSSSVSPTSGAPLTSASYLCHSEGGDTICSAAEYAQNKKLIERLIREGNNFTEVTPDPRLDALAAGGPKAPAYIPTPTTCATYTSQVKRWAAYQNAHRPVGARSVPTSDQQAYIESGCQMGVVGG